MVVAWQVSFNDSRCKVEALSRSSNNNINHNQYLDSLKPTSSASFHNAMEKNNENHQFQEQHSRNSMVEEDAIIARRTPDDHYAKHHPGAGWAGYKHPMYGGYLDHLHLQPTAASCSDKTTANVATAASATTTTTSTSTSTSAATLANHNHDHSSAEPPALPLPPPLPPPPSHPFHSAQANHNAVGNNNQSDKGSAATRTSSLPYLKTLQENNSNVWEEGKPADYGDDIRWGAQVYLDGL
ncbi:unnamed protein product [Cylindrotheca closterium]|uniref:Uncharacterized protein n=1 Tax=Cylindrotheca closterium TaxID=2856 RepID=A0AAD2JPN1_9STRA|nr:unnamed protein product [Cylindrotheca closterium]